MGTILIEGGGKDQDPSVRIISLIDGAIRLDVMLPEKEMAQFPSLDCRWTMREGMGRSRRGLKWARKRTRRYWSLGGG